eukprot:2101544-Pyramimonas_sp.AAC.1
MACRPSPTALPPTTLLPNPRRLLLLRFAVPFVAAGRIRRAGGAQWSESVSAPPPPLALLPEPQRKRPNPTP